ncbi:MAG: hypothetical protein ICV52_08145 [Microcoleus sp. C1-bin4]|nr:hypothetical protein [Microcoleus sp. C1-bin4]
MDPAAADRVGATALAGDGSAAKTVLKACCLLVSSWCALKNGILRGLLRLALKYSIVECKRGARSTPQLNWIKGEIIPRIDF